MSKLGTVQRLELGGRRVAAWVPNVITSTTPILVAHDAQNYLIPKSETWNGQNWQAVEALEAGRILPDAQGNLPLILSIHLNDEALRLNELAPEDYMRANPHLWKLLPPELTPPNFEPFGNSYAEAIAKRVVPEACERWGITHSVERTAIAGSSMGGLASLYAIGRHPQTFGAALAYSTHWPIGGMDLVNYLVEALPVGKGHRFWTDRGSVGLDASYEPFHLAAITALESRGLARDQDFIASVFYGTDHCEDHWARRVELPINWWLQAL